MTSRRPIAWILAALGGTMALAWLVVRTASLPRDEQVSALPPPAARSLVQQDLSPATMPTAQASGATPSTQPIRLRERSNLIGAERDLYAWLKRTLKQGRPSAAEALLMSIVVQSCQRAAESRQALAHMPQELLEELKFRCAGFTPDELAQALTQLTPIARDGVYDLGWAASDGRCQSAWALEQQMDWLPEETAACMARGQPGMSPTFFGSPNKEAARLALLLELSLTDWGARDGMAPSQMHTMHLLVCASTGRACGTPSDQLARIKQESEGPSPFPLSEIERMRPLVREYLRHPDLNVVGLAPEQPKMLSKARDKTRKP